MLKIKNLLSKMPVLILVIISLFTTVNVYAAESQILTQKYIAAMSKSELLATLKENGLILPEDYAEHIDLAENFVYEYTPMLIQGKIDPATNPFNYEQSNKMLQNLENVLYNLGLITRRSLLANSNYVLQYSTPIGSWDNSYLNYNCYAYSLGRTSGLQPGELSGANFSITMSISQIADVVLNDLDTQGYSGYKTTTKPTSLPDSFFKVIAVRKDNSNIDYHFMRPYGGSLNSWCHKPGPTQPLKWKDSSPNSKIWNNEAISNGVTLAPNVTYESTIYYIVYKHRSSPGIQPKSVE